jgi:hypothetical protein
MDRLALLAHGRVAEEGGVTGATGDTVAASVRSGNTAY